MPHKTGRPSAYTKKAMAAEKTGHKGGTGHKGVTGHKGSHKGGKK